MRRLRNLSIAAIAVALCHCSDSNRNISMPKPGDDTKIFEAYNSSGVSILSSGWVKTFDMSGVSFDSKRTCTLITPRHVVMAKHFKRDVGAEVIFHDRSGQPCNRKLLAIKDCEGDVAVGLLDEPVTNNHRSYALPWSKSDVRRLITLPVAVTDQDRNIFFHHVRKINSEQIYLGHVAKQIYGQKKTLIVGDSGNPCFFIKNNTLVLANTLHMGGAGVGPYFGATKIQESINQAVKELDPEYGILIEQVGD